MKLSKTQQDLYEALRNGVVIYYMPYAGNFNPHAYFFRSDSNQRVTAAADALQKKGIAKLAGGWRDRKLVLSEEGRIE